MGALFGNTGTGFWNKFPGKPPGSNSRRRRRSQSSNVRSGNGGNGGGSKFNFPMRQALTASALALTGDTIAQLVTRWRDMDKTDSDSEPKDIFSALLSKHDWLRALRMSSYGFLLYGPGSYAWYQYLDHTLPKPTVENLVAKVILNQVVLGPCVIAAVFAWNNVWQGKASELPAKYQKDALPTLLYGFRFWIPVSILNFWLVPLQARVAFMSTGSIFWNFYLSSTMSK